MLYFLAIEIHSLPVMDSVDTGMVRQHGKLGHDFQHEGPTLRPNLIHDTRDIPYEPEDVTDEGNIRDYPYKKAKTKPTQGYRKAAKSVAKLPCRQPTWESEEEVVFTHMDFCILVVSIISYLFDMGSDLALVCMYYSSQQWLWFGLTLAFILVPSTVGTIFSLRWYIEDNKQHSLIIQPLRIALILLQMAPVVRSVQAIIYGLRSRQMTDEEARRHWYHQMMLVNTDAALLSLFECFLEAAPQLILQIYILTLSGAGNEGDHSHLLVILQQSSILSSMMSIAWSMSTYHYSLRLSLHDKLNMSNTAFILHFLWHFFIIASRIIAISLFTSHFKHWIFIILTLHWWVMLAWILHQNTDFCQKEWEENMFNAVVACVYVFSYLNLTEGHTRLRYLFYYILVYIENAVMILTWYYFIGEVSHVWYKSYAVVAVLLGFVIGVILQVIYYLTLHPNNYCTGRKGIPLWRPLHELLKVQNHDIPMEKLE